nr:TPA_asm: M55 uORF 2 [Murid betaherpesvirus 1]DBA08007.1 TPA_asm: M55 uORF 2 [Murid betaherpesvirus 1]
MSGRETRADR